MKPGRILVFCTTWLALTGAARSAILTMGAGQAYTTLAAAVSAASAGDVIDVLAGTYVDQVATINVPLTIRGVGGAPVFTQTPGTELPGLKGYLIVNADLTVDNLVFRNAAISDDNGGNAAGIRYQAGNLIVIGSQFQNDQNGILATPAVAGTGSMVVRNSVFTGNGQGSGPRAGYEHAIYAGPLASVTVIGSQFLGTLAGHDIKSRAAVTTVTGNTLEDGVTGTASYAIDVSNGGAATIQGNRFDQGPNTENATIVAYAAEGPIWADNALLVQGNVFVNTNSTATGVFNHADTVTAQVVCNAFQGVDVLTQGPAALSGNVTGTATLPACGLAVAEPSGLAAWLFAPLVWLGLRRQGTRMRLAA